MFGGNDEALRISREDELAITPTSETNFRFSRFYFFDTQSFNLLIVAHDLFLA